MARIIPDLNEASLQEFQSRAEAKVYRKCKSLGPKYLVLFSVPWIHVTPYGTPRDGETDFIVFHPQKGILVIEVKGGGIRHDPLSNAWTSRDRHGKTHKIKNPFAQSKDSKHALIKYLKRIEAGRRCKFGPSLVMPFYFQISMWQHFPALLSPPISLVPIKVWILFRSGLTPSLLIGPFKIL